MELKVFAWSSFSSATAAACAPESRVEPSKRNIGDNLIAMMRLHLVGAVTGEERVVEVAKQIDRWVQSIEGALRKAVVKPQSEVRRQIGCGSRRVRQGVAKGFEVGKTY